MTAEEVTTGFSTKFLDNNKIWVCYLSQSHRYVLDTWAQKVIEMDEAHRHEEVRYMYVVSIGLAMTPYAQQKIKEIQIAHPESRGKVALVIPNVVLAGVLNAMNRREYVNAQPNIRSRIFSKELPALHWLRNDNE
jgi:hypothetical protein